MGLRRWNEYHDHEYFKVKHFFTVDKLMADWLNSNTNTIGHYLPAGVFESECYMADKDNASTSTSCSSVHAATIQNGSIDQSLMQFLEQTYGKRFAHFGNDGKHIVRGDELNRVYASAKVVVGDTLCIDFTYPHYWSDRIYETTGRGGMIVHPFIRALTHSLKTAKKSCSISTVT